MAASPRPRKMLTPEALLPILVNRGDLAPDATPEDQTKALAQAFRDLRAASIFRVAPEQRQAFQQAWMPYMGLTDNEGPAKGFWEGMREGVVEALPEMGGAAGGAIGGAVLGGPPGALVGGIAGGLGTRALTGKADLSPWDLLYAVPGGTAKIAKETLKGGALAGGSAVKTLMATAKEGGVIGKALAGAKKAGTKAGEIAAPITDKGLKALGKLPPPTDEYLQALARAGLSADEIRTIKQNRASLRRGEITRTPQQGGAPIAAQPVGRTPEARRAADVVRHAREGGTPGDEVAAFVRSLESAGATPEMVAERLGAVPQMPIAGGSVPIPVGPGGAAGHADIKAVVSSLAPEQRDVVIKELLSQYGASDLKTIMGLKVPSVPKSIRGGARGGGF